MAPYPPCPEADTASGSSLHIREPLVFEALVRGGRGEFLGIGTCGDALAADTQKGFFAVADSPERNPSAACRFLGAAEEMAGSLPARDKSRASGEKEIEAEAEFIEEKFNQLIRSVGPNESTTFTGLFILGGRSFGKAFLLHNGDSLLYHIRTKEGTVCQESLTNHCLVGKVGSVFQRKLMGFSEESRFILATDGLLDITREIRKLGISDPLKIFADAARSLPVDRLASSVLERYEPAPEMSDDLAVIALDPNSIFTKEQGRA